MSKRESDINSDINTDINGNLRFQIPFGRRLLCDHEARLNCIDEAHLAGKQAVDAAGLHSTYVRRT